MSKLDELITNLCPNGVQYFDLEKVCEVYDGTHQTPEYTTTGVKFVSVQNISALYETNKYISHADYEKFRIKPQKGDVFMTRIGSIGVCAVVDRDESLGYYVSLALLRPDQSKITSNFLKHIIESNYGKKELLKRTLVDAVPIKINKNEIGKIIIPIPPLEVQEEIVRILDEYSEKNIQLITALSTELDARKVQYEYYRGQIFANKCLGIEPSTIKDVCIKTCSGGTPKTSHSSYYGGDIPWLRTQEVDWADIYDTEIKITDEGLKNSSAKLIPENCVIVAMYGATAAKSAINKIPLTTNQACCNLQINPQKARYQYVYYWLCYEYLRLKSLGRGSQDNLNADMIKNYPIVVPTLDVQDDIIATLDKYASTEVEYEKSIQNEIQLRQVQYEYYRDKLLTFEEAT